MEDLTAAEDLTTDLVSTTTTAAPPPAEVEPWAVLAAVEATLRAATPSAPARRVDDLATVLALTAVGGVARSS